MCPWVRVRYGESAGLGEFSVSFEVFGFGEKSVFGDLSSQEGWNSLGNFRCLFAIVILFLGLVRFPKHIRVPLLLYIF